MFASIAEQYIQQYAGRFLKNFSATNQFHISLNTVRLTNVEINVDELQRLRSAYRLRKCFIGEISIDLSFLIFGGKLEVSISDPLLVFDRQQYPSGNGFFDAPSSPSSSSTLHRSSSDEVDKKTGRTSGNSNNSERDKGTSSSTSSSSNTERMQQGEEYSHDITDEDPDAVLNMLQSMISVIYFTLERFYRLKGGPESETNTSDDNNITGNDGLSNIPILSAHEMLSIQRILEKISMTIYRIHIRVDEEFTHSHVKNIEFDTIASGILVDKFVVRSATPSEITQSPDSFVSVDNSVEGLLVLNKLCYLQDLSVYCRREVPLLDSLSNEWTERDRERKREGTIVSPGDREKDEQDRLQFTLQYIQRVYYSIRQRERDCPSLSSYGESGILLQPTNITVYLGLGFQRISRIFGPIRVNCKIDHLHIHVTDEQTLYIYQVIDAVREFANRLQRQARVVLIHNEDTYYTTGSYTSTTTPSNTTSEERRRLARLRWGLVRDSIKSDWWRYASTLSNGSIRWRVWFEIWRQAGRYLALREILMYHVGYETWQLSGAGSSGSNTGVPEDASVSVKTASRKSLSRSITGGGGAFRETLKLYFLSNMLVSDSTRVRSKRRVRGGVSASGSVSGSRGAYVTAFIGEGAIPEEDMNEARTLLNLQVTRYLDRDPVTGTRRMGVDPYSLSSSTIKALYAIQLSLDAMLPMQITGYCRLRAEQKYHRLIARYTKKMREREKERERERERLRESAVKERESVKEKDYSNSEVSESTSTSTISLSTCLSSSLSVPHFDVISNLHTGFPIPIGVKSGTDTDNPNRDGGGREAYLFIAPIEITGVCPTFGASSANCFLNCQVLKPQPNRDNDPIGVYNKTHGSSKWKDGQRLACTLGQTPVVASYPLPTPSSTTNTSTVSNADNSGISSGSNVNGNNVTGNNVNGNNIDNSSFVQYRQAFAMPIVNLLSRDTITDSISGERVERLRHPMFEREGERETVGSLYVEAFDKSLLTIKLGKRTIPLMSVHTHIRDYLSLSYQSYNQLSLPSSILSLSRSTESEIETHTITLSIVEDERDDGTPVYHGTPVDGTPVDGTRVSSVTIRFMTMCMYGYMNDFIHARDRFMSNIDQALVERKQALLRMMKITVNPSSSNSTTTIADTTFNDDNEEQFVLDPSKLTLQQVSSNTYISAITITFYAVYVHPVEVKARLMSERLVIPPLQSFLPLSRLSLVDIRTDAAFSSNPWKGEASLSLGQYAIELAICDPKTNPIGPQALQTILSLPLVRANVRFEQISTQGRYIDGFLDITCFDIATVTQCGPLGLSFDSLSSGSPSSSCDTGSTSLGTRVWHAVRPLAHLWIPYTPWTRNVSLLSKENYYHSRVRVSVPPTTATPLTTDAIEGTARVISPYSTPSRVSSQKGKEKEREREREKVKREYVSLHGEAVQRLGDWYSNIFPRHSNVVRELFLTTTQSGESESMRESERGDVISLPIQTVSLRGETGVGGRPFSLNISLSPPTVEDVVRRSRAIYDTISTAVVGSVGDEKGSNSSVSTTTTGVLPVEEEHIVNREEVRPTPTTSKASGLFSWFGGSSSSTGTVSTASSSPPTSTSTVSNSLSSVLAHLKLDDVQEAVIIKPNGGSNSGGGSGTTTSGVSNSGWEEEKKQLLARIAELEKANRELQHRLQTNK